MGSVGTFECAHTEGSVDALGQDGPINAPKKKQRRRTIKERRDIVEETLVPGASVVRVARRHEVNANQVFYWRKLYREGQLGITIATPLLPGEGEDGATYKNVVGERAAVVLGNDGNKALERNTAHRRGRG